MNVLIDRLKIAGKSQKIDKEGDSIRVPRDENPSSLEEDFVEKEIDQQNLHDNNAFHTKADISLSYEIPEVEKTEVPEGVAVIYKDFKNLIADDQGKKKIDVGKQKGTKVFKEDDDLIVFLHNKKFQVVTYNKAQPRNYGQPFKEDVIIYPEKNLRNNKLQPNKHGPFKGFPTASGLLPKGPRIAVNRVCNYFNRLCQRVIDPEKMISLESENAEIMCQLERFFPPSLFDIMFHLPLHLAREARLGGQYTSGGYIHLRGECIAFCMEFLRKSVPVQEPVNRNEDVQADGNVLEGRPLQKATDVFWSILEHMGHEEHGGTWHMEAAQLDTQRKKGEAILKTSSTVYSTNRSSSSTRPAKLQLDRAEKSKSNPKNVASPLTFL
ncbi:unnamed protein product [Microthlaspi erraticum]|uniref:DUF4218 domain-containing protein n=1 Tax=Microthlaspi erraticum TaxID=1685480 RepID=A0A6D2J7E2_9BRAS|nr:unnamed protein product [Microthlaspi erraticum]